MTAQPYLYDRSGRRYSLSAPRWRGDDGTPLGTGSPGVLSPSTIDPRERSVWRYESAIPVDRRHRVTLGEGCTPMLPVEWCGQRVYMKLEWFNPTSSFKDRGVAVMMSHLKSQGVENVVEDSSGNGGSSVAAYAAAAGMSAEILVPEATSDAKVAQIRAYGARVELIGGTRQDVAAEALRRSASTSYASHNWHPLFLQGTKTIAYEMWEDLGFTLPDNVVIVAGAGSNVLGCDLAFSELVSSGQSERLPRLLVGQPEHWAAIAETLEGSSVGAPTVRTPTIAEGASIASPVRLAEAVDAIRRSGGAVVRVTDKEIRAAVQQLGARGLFVEPTSGVAVAALSRFIGDGTIRPAQRTVVILTGSGLKGAGLLADGPANAPGG